MLNSRQRWLRVGLAGTTVIKLGGIGLVLHDYFTDPAGLTEVTLAAAAFFVTVAQGLEVAIRGKK